MKGIHIHQVALRIQAVQGQGVVTLPTGKTSPYDMVSPVDFFETVLLS